MNRRLHRAVNRWLRAESAEAAGCERALRSVFRALPAPPLPAGFAERVLLAAGVAVPRRVATPLGWRLALAGALALAAAAVATAPPIVTGLLGRITPGDVLRFAAGAVVETCQRLAEGLAVWRAASSIGDTFAEVLLAPWILTVMLAATLLSAGGFRMLYGLLAVERRVEDVRA